jgi:hypothetical protein
LNPSIQELHLMHCGRFRRLPPALFARTGAIC